MGQYINIVTLLIINFLSILANTDMVLDIGSSPVINCEIPGNYSVDTVTLVFVKTNKLLAKMVPSYHTNTKQCYSDIRVYNFQLYNISIEDEGRYRCRFSLLSSVMYETRFTLYVMPEMNSYSRFMDDKIIYVCNRSISLYDNRVKLDMVIGGVYIRGNSLKTIKTKNAFYTYTVGNKNYTDWAKTVTCIMSLNGIKRENVLNIISVEDINKPDTYNVYNDLIYSI
ncbi:V-type Ig domain [Turkeypox virus]|uniref:V-type Ig domain n=1 Tax=Turkeypox virus TaxID=336486 RepID=A0A0M5I226_9POXV|nr:V-type Ig domain [Turkeypox virus]ALA62521.1 V-type Ig domain [Turkeypox virus]